MIQSHEIIVDLFAGGGGASTGILTALGRHPDIAVDHCSVATRVHTANHPSTKHYCADVFDVDPVEICRGAPVGLLWASPSCTQFSKVNTGKALDPKIRSLANVVVEWAKTVNPRCIILENVAEFTSWGPLDADNRPIKNSRGENFIQWKRELESLGYIVEYRTLVAADYGAPTARKRLFLVARCDGIPIAWPAPTHGEKTAAPWHTALDIIDWSIQTPSIFGRDKPLTEATLRRIAEGMRKYAITPKTPYVAPSRVIPTLIQIGYGERKGQLPRVPGIHKPLGTVVAGGVKHALVCGHLTSSTNRTEDVESLLLDYTSLKKCDIEAAKERNVLLCDIGMRLLTPRELLRAQDFPADYKIEADTNGKLVTKTQQVSIVGNAVCPSMAKAIVKANLGRHSSSS